MWLCIALLAAIPACLFASNAPGPWVPSTRGAVWPKPADQRRYSYVFQYNPETLQFFIHGPDCQIINAGIERYQRYLRKMALGRSDEDDKPLLPSITSVSLLLNGSCEYLPYMDMPESYTVKVLPGTNGAPNGEAAISSRSVWGLLRGLETFSQLSYYNGSINQLLIEGTYVADAPRFAHRGLMIDSSRHYLPIATIKTMLKAMEANKMNVLHWHIVDDQSFPYQSDVFPSLSKKGAYAKGMVYTRFDIADIVEFARLRGIRVIVEFDTPGHTASWGKGHPGLLTPCYTSGNDYFFGAIDPSNEDNYKFLATLWQEIHSRFPDHYLHLGGDEVDFTCWKNDPDISKFMESLGLKNDYPGLESYYIKRVINLTQSLQRTPIVWQEVFQNDLDHTIDNSTIVHVWFGDQESVLSKVTAAGYRALLSTCWYLDHFEQSLYAGGGDWRRLYRCDPWAFQGTQEQKRLIVGGEACMWGEYVDHTNILQRVWPRASAAAERLWSRSFNEDLAASRLEEHVCRMRVRGIPAQPANGPSFCDL